MKRLFVGILLGLCLVVSTGEKAHSLGIKVAPVEYRTELKSGEKKRGFIDISNPGLSSLRVGTSVEAFRQIDNKGSLQFFKNEAFASGVRLDLEEFVLGPREALRMYFELDGKKLPTGDNFGAIFFTTASEGLTGSSIGQQVRIGTLLSIVNGTPSDNKAEVTKLSTNFVHMGETIEGSFTVYNTGDITKSTGFYPKLTVRLWPWGETKEITGKLVFASRSRDNDFSLKSPLLGVYKLEVSHADSKKARWIVVAKPIAVIVLGLIALSLAIGTTAVRRRVRRSKVVQDKFQI